MGKVITRKIDGEESWFPGHWIGGITLVLGPLLLLAGVVLRIQYNFFFPEQLAAFKERPTLMVVSYSAFSAGNILLWPAIVTLTKLIGTKRPGWALWGGIFAIFVLFARTFHAGIDHLAFQVARVRNVEQATEIVSDSYGAFHIFSIFNLAIMLGWIVLAIGTYRSGILNLYRSVSLGLMASLPLGVLKGTTPFSVVASVGLCIALVPLGFQVLRDGPTPGLRTALGWFLLIAVLGILFYFIGQAG